MATKEDNYSVNERVKQIMEHMNLVPNSFAKHTGIGVAALHKVLKKQAKPGYDTLKLILDSTNVNANWLMCGRGNMITTTEATPTKEFVFRTDKRVPEQAVPLYSLEAAAGLVQLFNEPPDVLEYIRIPNMPKCDGAIHITGDSMYPLLKSGDIVLYKQVHDIANGIFYGEMYLLSIKVGDEEIITVKYIQKSELGPEYIKLVSYNDHHAPKDVQINTVRALAYIKASIRINSMS